MEWCRVRMEHILPSTAFRLMEAGDWWLSPPAYHSGPAAVLGVDTVLAAGMAVAIAVAAASTVGATCVASAGAEVAR